MSAIVKKTIQLFVCGLSTLTLLYQHAFSLGLVNELYISGNTPINESIFYYNPNRPLEDDLVFPFLRMDFDPSKSQAEAEVMKEHCPEAVKGMTKGFRFRFKNHGPYYRLWFGWGENFNRFPNAKLFRRYNRYIKQLEDIYDKTPHLSNSLTKLVNAYDLFFREANGIVMITTDNGQKVLGSARITNFRKNQPLFGGSAQGIRYFKDGAVELFTGRGANWGSNFFEIGSPYVPKERIFSKEFVKNHQEKVVETRERAAELLQKLKKVVSDRELYKTSNHPNITNHFHLPNELPESTFLEPIPWNNYKKSTGSQFYLNVRNHFFKSPNDDYRKLQEQVFALAALRIPYAAELARLLMELYPDEWFDVAELGRLTISPKLGVYGWFAIQSGILHLLKQRGDINKMKIFAEVASDYDSKSPREVIERSEQIVVKSMISLGMAIESANGAIGVERAFILSVMARNFYSNIEAILGGQKWVVDIADNSIDPKPNKIYRRDKRIIYPDKKIPNMQFTDENFTLIPK